MSTPLPPLAHPGLPLGPSSLYTPGPGTHLSPSPSYSHIHASLAGRPILLSSSSSSTTTTSNSLSKLTLTLSNKTTKPTPPTSNAKATISVPSILPSPTNARPTSKNISNKNVLPEVGSVVLARVNRVRGRGVDVGILVVYDKPIEGGPGGGKEKADGENGGWGEGNVCGEEWQGVIRREDVRATERDGVVCAEGFRVGDVVRGVVISLGDQSNYYLTTGKNDLGVVMAKSEAGNTMVPISWREFRDPVTGATESRKVAKPF